MGMYLNSISPYYLYKSEFSRPYFVDKSEVLKELILGVIQKKVYQNLLKCVRYMIMKTPNF